MISSFPQVITLHVAEADGLCRCVLGIKQAILFEKLTDVADCEPPPYTQGAQDDD